MADDDIRKVVADYFDKHDPHPDFDAEAANLIAALCTAGLIIAPTEPTEAMLKAAEREWDGRMSARSAGVYQAMLKAWESESE